MPNIYFILFFEIYRRYLQFKLDLHESMVPRVSDAKFSTKKRKTASVARNDVILSTTAPQHYIYSSSPPQQCHKNCRDFCSYGCLKNFYSSPLSTLYLFFSCFFKESKPGGKIVPYMRNDGCEGKIVQG